jgi:hypothetical protein
MTENNLRAESVGPTPIYFRWLILAGTCVFVFLIALSSVVWAGLASVFHWRARFSASGDRRLRTVQSGAGRGWDDVWGGGFSQHHVPRPNCGSPRPGGGIYEHGCGGPTALLLLWVLMPETRPLANGQRDNTTAQKRDDA